MLFIHEFINFNEYRIKKMTRTNPVDLMSVRIKLTERILKAKFELEKEMSKPVNNYKIKPCTTSEEYNIMAKIIDW